MLRAQLLLGVFFPCALALLPGQELNNPLVLVTALTAGIAMAVLVCASCTRVGSVAELARIRTGVLRERASRTAYLRLRDPDTPGHARPRAPAATVAAVSAHR